MTDLLQSRQSYIARYQPLKDHRPESQTASQFKTILTVDDNYGGRPVIRAAVKNRTDFRGRPAPSV
jgi:hypothetical protein